MRLLAITAVALAASTASAALLESEPNNSPATANFIADAVYASTGGFAFDGTISTDDVDFISINLNAGDVVGAAVFDSLFSGGDPMIVALDSSLAQVAFDDDATGLDPFIRFAATTSGVHYIGVTGFGDSAFIGAHSEVFSYKLIVGVNRIPEPATLGLLAGAAMLGLRRRA